MKFKEPFKLYTAETNVEAHMIVNMLVANGIEAYADEDNSGVSLWALGVLSQFHQPNVWIEKSTTPKAVELIRCFEEQKREAGATRGEQIRTLCGMRIVPERPGLSRKPQRNHSRLPVLPSIR